MRCGIITKRFRTAVPPHLPFLRALTSYRRARRYDMAEDILKVLAEDYPDDLAAAGRRRKSAARPKR